MTTISISLKGVDQAIDNLNYRPGSVKQTLIYAIRAFYTSEESIKKLKTIETDTLIKSIWNIELDSKIKTKRRNFSSLKSSVNTDLKKLSKKGLNPENIIICDANIFDMSEAAKNDLLSTITDSANLSAINLDQAGKILGAVTVFLENFQGDDPDTDKEEITDQIKKILNKITTDVLTEKKSEKIDESEADPLDQVTQDDIEEIELDDDEVLEKIAVEDEVDVINPEEDEEIELAEDEVIETIDIHEDEEFDDSLDLDSSDKTEADNPEHNPEDDSEEIELEDDEELEIIKIDEDEESIELEEIVDTEEDLEDAEEIEALELDDDELEAFDEFREQRNQAEQFDEILGEREKKYNTYALVPEGQYTIGTKKDIKSSLELQQFDMPQVYMGTYPVTNSLFEIFIDETGYVTTAEVAGFGRVYYSRFQKRADGSTWLKNAGSQDIKGACWYKPAGPESSLHGKRNHPVVQVSAEDATAFASWIGRRLPTEAEWEAAAKTDFGYDYPWGDEFNPNALNIEQTGHADTCSVDTYDEFANPFNIKDLLGNVMEWTSDMEYPSINLIKPVKHCVAKGVAWNARGDAAISSRTWFKTGFTSNTIGFRCMSEVLL